MMIPGFVQLSSQKCHKHDRKNLFGPKCHGCDFFVVYGYIYLMKHKSETFEKFKEFQSEVKNHRNKKIKFLRSDHGGEYLSYEFGLQLKQCGIVSQTHATWNTTA